MPRKTKPSGKNDVQYARFLRSLELVNIALIESQAKIDREAFFESDEELLIKAFGRPSKIKKDHFELEALLTVDATKKKKHTNSFHVKAVFVMHIHAKPPFGRDVLDRFSEHEGRLIVWPYLREYLANLCVRMHVPPILLPLPELE